MVVGEFEKSRWIQCVLELESMVHAEELDVARERERT